MNLSFDMGLNLEAEQDKIYDVIIIGSGPAGLSAAIYAGRAYLDTMMLTGDKIGGQVALTHEVENFPGFPEGVAGPELVQRWQAQAERFGAILQIDSTTAVDLSQRPFRLTGYNGEYRARALIIATGAAPRKLDVPGEKELIGRGVSYCATCDGWFFREKEVVMVGGGDSAVEEALFLTKYARKVTIIHRRDQLRAGPTLQKRAFANEKIEFIWNAIVTEIIGEGGVKALRLKNTRSGEEWEHATNGIFVSIGHVPNTGLFKDQLEIDEHGYLVTDGHMATSVEGVWAAGEVTDSVFRQMITSAGMGAAAAIQVQRWLDEQEGEIVAPQVPTTPG